MSNDMGLNSCTRCGPLLGCFCAEQERIAGLVEAEGEHAWDPSRKECVKCRHRACPVNEPFSYAQQMARGETP